MMPPIPERGVGCPIVPPRSSREPHSLPSASSTARGRSCWPISLRDLRLTDGPLGLALTAGFVGSLPVMVGGGHLTDRYGARALAIGSGVLLALAYGAIALVGGFAALVVVLFAFYAASGAFDVAINAAAIGVERATGRHLLSAFHAAFSGGGMLGALGAGALLAAGLPFRSAYVAVMIVLLGVAVAWSRIPLPAAPPSAPGARGGSLYRDRRLLLLAGITGARVPRRGSDGDVVRDLPAHGPGAAGGRGSCRRGRLPRRDARRPRRRQPSSGGAPPRRAGCAWPGWRRPRRWPSRSPPPSRRR